MDVDSIVTLVICAIILSFLFFLTGAGVGERKTKRNIATLGCVEFCDEEQNCEMRSYHKNTCTCTNGTNAYQDLSGMFTEFGK